MSDWTNVKIDFDMLDSNNVTLQWRKERTRKATLESHRERTRQNARTRFGPNGISTAMVCAMVDDCLNLEALEKLCNSYGLPITWEVEKKVDKAAEIQLLRDQAKALEKRIEKLEHGKWGKEPANGGMFKVEKTYTQGGQKYVYLAVKANGLWYLTGTNAEGQKSYTWDGLKAFAGKYARVWRLTVAEELLD
jgi:predicted aminopeptidase